MKRLECLDGLRGVLAVYVMLGHAVPFVALPPWLARPLSHGGAAVDVFFVLSGLVILRSLEACEFAARPFLIARMARIFPVYLAMLAVGVAVQTAPVDFAAMPWIAAGGPARDIVAQGWPAHWVWDLAAHVTMTHGLLPNGIAPDIWVGFLGAAWSLSTEWQFYVLALLFGRTRMGVLRLSVLFLAIALAGLAWNIWAPEPWHFSRAFLPNKAAFFALGIASGLWAGEGRVRPFAAVLCAALAICAASGTVEKLLPPLVWTVCMAAQMAPGRLRPLAALLRARPIQWLGAVSFPIYLANEPIQKILLLGLAPWAGGDPVLFGALWLPAAVLLPIAAAGLLHRYLEVPAHRWGRSLAGRPDQAMAPRAATGHTHSTRPPRTPTYQS